MTTTLTARNLVRRFNRRFADTGLRLCKTRGRALQSSLGDYIIVANRHNPLFTILEHHVQLEQLGRELGVLTEGEHVAARH